MRLDCGHESENYGRDYVTGKKHCYACCAERERACMMASGRITLYLTCMSNDEWKAFCIMTDRTFYPDDDSQLRFVIMDFTGLLRIAPTHVRMPKRDGQTSVYFFGPDGYLWYGRHRGRYNQLLHCRRLVAQETPLHWTEQSLPTDRLVEQARCNFYVYTRPRTRIPPQDRAPRREHVT